MHARVSHRDSPIRYIIIIIKYHNNYIIRCIIISCYIAMHHLDLHVETQDGTPV